MAEAKARKWPWLDLLARARYFLVAYARFSVLADRAELREAATRLLEELLPECSDTVGVEDVRDAAGYLVITTGGVSR